MTIQEYIAENRFHDFGLNADWAVSLYHITKGLYLFDNEDDTYMLVRRENPYHIENEENNITEYLARLDDDELSKLQEILENE